MYKRTTTPSNTESITWSYERGIYILSVLLSINYTLNHDNKDCNVYGESKDIAFKDNIRFKITATLVRLIDARPGDCTLVYCSARLHVLSLCCSSYSYLAVTNVNYNIT